MEEPRGRTQRSGKIHCLLLTAMAKLLLIGKTPISSICAVTQRPFRNGNRIPVSQYHDIAFEMSKSSAKFEHRPRKISRASSSLNFRQHIIGCKLEKISRSLKRTEENRVPSTVRETSDTEPQRSTCGPSILQNPAEWQSDP